MREEKATRTPQDNDTREKVTVSIRNMPTDVWYKAGYNCKINKITLSDYVVSLIEKDLEQDTSEQ